jgi:uncharacterized membrane protein
MRRPRGSSPRARPGAIPERERAGKRETGKSDAMKRLAYILAAMVFLALLLSSQTSPQEYDEEWWNGSWHYRIKLTVNTSYHERFEWPVEHEVNFTSLLEDLNITDGFDENSTRVVEVNASGDMLHELPSQFDSAEGYDAYSNAAGTLVFILNGTTPSHTERWFYLYFDAKGAPKAEPSYSTIMSRDWDGDEFNITFNTQGGDHYGFFVFDTNRSENTSGLYRYWLKDDIPFEDSGPSERTREFIHTTDGVENLTYDLRGNASLAEGPARITVRQEGYEVYWNDPDNRTNMTYLRKSYYFYPNKTWFVVEHEIININDSESVSRGSYAGIPGFDVLGAYESGYKVTPDQSQEPGSTVYGAPGFGMERGGYAHLWESGTSNFIAGNSSTGGDPDHDRIGINLSATDIQPGESIKDRAALIFFHTINSPDLLTDTRDRLVNNVNITEGEPELWLITPEPRPDHDIYNRNESAILATNITRDDWSLVDHVNATMDMGTPGVSGDDVTIQFLDDGVFPDPAAGDRNYTAYYNFSDSETPGYWNMTARAYDADGTLLNESYYTFNLTAELWVNITFWNVTGIYRVDNATLNVTNLRQDIPIPNAAEINCTTNYEQIPPENITDYNNGTYTVTFQTPYDYGAYPLNCSFGEDGSWGFDEKNYNVESPETNVSIIPDPALYNAYNVRFYENESFNLEIALHNIGNSSTRELNFTLDLPGNLSSNYTSSAGYCGQLLIGESCIRDFNITILNNSFAMDYIINITANWTNRVGSLGSNTSNVTVTVHENPVLDVLQENVTGILPPGAPSQAIESLLARSLGNNDTLNITLTPINLDNFSIQFNPPNISIMGPGEEQTVQVMASVPSGQFPGVYEGWINVTSDNGGYELLNTTIIVTGTNLTINATPDTYTALYITAFSNESLEFAVNVTNTGNTTAFNSYVNVTLPGSWYIDETNQSCGNLTKGEVCMTYFFVNITELTHAGNYSINATVFWEDIGTAWKNRNDTINVSVISNITLEVLEDEFEGVMEHGTSMVIGNMSVRSTGNDDALFVNFTLSGEFDNFTIEFNQSHPFNMTPGDFRTVRINATIPPGFDPGYYNGTLNVTSENNGNKTLSLNITVPENGSWTADPTYCEHAQSPNSGIVCDVLINNTGNIQLNFSVYPPSETNHTTPSWSSYNLGKQNSTNLTIYYDMGTEAGSQFFLTNYTINTTEAAAEPDNITLEIVLNPFVEPLIEIGAIPSMTQQAESVTIVVNVTSQSGAEFDDIIMTVERPNGTNDTLQLGFSHQVFWYGANPCKQHIEEPDDKLCYMATYPADLSGNSSGRGNYTIYVYANDTYAVNATNTSVLGVYARYMVYLDMPDTDQGNWESINYRAHDHLGAPLPGASVNLSIRDPDNRSVYLLSGNEYTTDEGGWVPDNIFVIPAHATLGEYTIHSNGTWYDPEFGLWVGNESTAKFNVTDKHTLTGKVGIPSPVVRDKNMPISVIVLQGFQPVDPDYFNISIFYTEGYDLDLVWAFDMNDFTRNTTGFYTLYEVTDNVLTGSYVALLEVTLGDKTTYDIQPFRIASSGPYDLNVTLDQKEVAPGNTLYFNITVWNKGEVDNEDVIIDYWVEGQGKSWDSGQITPNIGAGMQMIFRPENGLFIWSHQPPGGYTVEVRALYDPSIQAVPASEGFVVTGEAPPEEPGEKGGEAREEAPPSAAPAGQINITRIPSEVGAMAGLPRQFNIKVEALGGSVRNIWLEFQGIPGDWVITDPANISSLAAGQTAVIAVQITPPRGESGERRVRAVARSTESTDEEEFILRIFTSKKDLINFELVRLRAKLEELRDRADRAEEAGFDTREVDDLLDDAGNEIKLAEGYLKENLYDAALDSVYTAWRLLEEAEELLDKMLLGIAIPWWMFLMIIFALIIAVLIFFIRKIYQNLKLLVRGRLSEARQVAGTIRGAGLEVEKLREERRRTARMLLLLENQFKQGIISREAYESLKKRSEQRVAELDKKIRESLSA